jgi:hypothetical protein
MKLLPIVLKSYSASIVNLIMSSSGGYRIFLGHLPREATKEDVREMLTEFRAVREVTVKDGYGFVVRREFPNLLNEQPPVHRTCTSHLMAS